jgi:UDP-N-acetylmuramate dehydrogenase
VFIQENFPLKKHNTFAINVFATWYVHIKTEKELKEAIDFAKEKKVSILILAGGSNILFTKNFEGLVINPDFTGIEITSEDDKHVYLKVGAGVNWDEFVGYSCSTNLWGVENLSLIPGKVGSSPIQNIGAYGTEVKDVIEEVIAYDTTNNEIVSLLNHECNFNYRSSIFKTTAKGRYIIISVVFRLKKFEDPILHYGNLKDKVLSLGQINLQNIRNTIIDIRKSKLPDTEVIGNGGSFFKNPVVENKKIQQLQKEYPDIPVYSIDNNYSKIAAGWLIELCGWKGYREGDAGVHDKQSLVLVNHNNASGQDIVNLAEKIKESVIKKFDIVLETEVNII